MNRARRRFLRLAANIAALSALGRGAAAETYPSRPVKLIVGLPAGGAPDIYARLLADWLSARLGQPFVVENRPGGSGNIATETVIRAAPDGYTLLMVIAPNVINPTLNPHLKFDFIRDTAPVASIGGSPFVHGGEPFTPRQDRSRLHRLRQSQSRQDQCRRRPASAISRTWPAELFKMMAGVDLAARALSRRDGGAGRICSADRVQVMFDPIPVGARLCAERPVARARGHVHASRMESFAGRAGHGAISCPATRSRGITGIVGPRGTPDNVVAVAQ